MTAAGMLRYFAVTAAGTATTRRTTSGQWREGPISVVATYTTNTHSLLQRKLTMSKRRLRPKLQPSPGPSIPICCFLLIVTAYKALFMRRCYTWILCRTHVISRPLLRNSSTTGIASTLCNGWRDWMHRIKEVLTTSTRTRWNRTDIIDSKQYVWAHRFRFQKTNDAFHSAGKRGKTLSREALLLEFDGVEWSFIIIPASLVLLILFFIALVDGKERQERKQQELNFFRQRAESLESVRKGQYLAGPEEND